MKSSGTAVYLYCIVRAARRPVMGRAPRGLPGGGRPVAQDVGGSLWVITSDVPLDTYGPSHLEPRLRDLDWVAEAAVAHEAVVEFCARARVSVVIPMKLFTMFSSIGKALDDVAGRRAVIDRTARHIAGCEEWGIRIARAPGAPAAGRRAPVASPGKMGAAFLEGRKEVRDAVRTARAEAAVAADGAFDRLRRLARDAQRRERRQEPGSNPPVLEAAFLVPAKALARFKVETRRQIKTCAAANAELTLTGPWPAYNFVDSAVARA